MDYSVTVVRRSKAPSGVRWQRSFPFNYFRQHSQLIVIAGNKHISNVWLKESSFDQTPNFCLFCMPRPSHSCPKASCSLPRYVSTAVAPRHTTKGKPAKIAWASEEMSVPRYTPEGSFSSQIQLTSIPQHTLEGRLKAAGGLRSPLAFQLHVTSRLLCFRTGVLHPDSESSQCNVSAVLYGPGPFTVKGSAHC